MRAYFQPDQATPSAEQLAKGYTLSKELESPAGVFVTLSHKGKSRACWGTVFPEHRNMVQATVDATLGALSREYRYPPIRAHEWPSLTPQVTLIRRIIPASSIQSINPLRDGLMVRSGGKSGVILPGEYGDAHTQLVQGKLKAGIQPGEPYQLYRIQADVFQ
jgi:AMMECR1 domain-containing protein